jgi:histidyl-tRNA synthetase
VVPNDTSLKVGSIVAGGRYDNLVGMFSKRNIPCVGTSFGIDRILTILKSRKTQPKSPSKIDVYIAAYGSSRLVEEKLSTARKLRRAGISVDFDTKADRKLGKQLDLAQGSRAALVVVLEDKLDSSGEVQIKMFAMLWQTVRDAEVISRATLVEEVQSACLSLMALDICCPYTMH